MRVIHPFFLLAVNAAVTSAQFVGTGQFYIDNQNPQMCVRDCEPGGPLVLPDSVCGGVVTDASIKLHSTVDDCCKVQLSWMDLALCKDKSNPSTAGTIKWWAGKSVQDISIARNLENSFLDQHNIVPR